MTSSPCRLLPAAFLLLPLLSGCLKPTYTADRLEEAVRDICRREYKFEVTARRVGKTLYAAIPSQSLVSADLGLDRKTVERLYDALLTVTRVTLSSDAEIDYLVVMAKDAGTGVALTLLRQVDDIKWYFYARISRADFEDRGVLEIGEAPDDPAQWYDVTPDEFTARLAASRIYQKIAYNPIVGALIRAGRVTGRLSGGVVVLRLDNADPLAPEAVALLRQMSVDRVGDVLEKYDKGASAGRLRVEDASGKLILEMSRDEILAERKRLPRKKPWEE